MFSKKHPHKPVCLAVHAILLLLLVLAVVIAVAGVITTLSTSGQMLLKTAQNSVALLTLVATVLALSKQMKAACEKCEACTK